MRIAILSRGVQGGGVQQMMRHTAEALCQRGYAVDLLVPAGRAATAPDIAVRPLQSTLPGHGRLAALRADPASWRALLRPVLLPLVAPSAVALLPALTRYLRSARPEALLSATTFLNLAALWAVAASGAPCRVLVSERDHLGSNLKRGRHAGAWRWRHLPPMLARGYARADAVVAVSEGVAEDLCRCTGLPPATVRVVYNPVVRAGLEARAAADSGLPWLDRPQQPVILAAGRLVEKKRFDLLLQAFARLRRERPVRLVLLGEGRQRHRLQALAGELGVTDAVQFAGWVDQPEACMRRASLLAMTSEREGFGNVLAEALACGCPVVSSDCPSGPAEILDGGRYGRLVPVGDVAALTAAMAQTLDAVAAGAIDREALRRRGAAFSADRAVDAYLDLLRLPRRAPETAPVAAIPEAPCASC